MVWPRLLACSGHLALAFRNQLLPTQFKLRSKLKSNSLASEAVKKFARWGHRASNSAPCESLEAACPHAVFPPNFEFFHSSPVWGMVGEG